MILWCIPYLSFKQCTYTYCLFAEVFHLKLIPSEKEISLTFLFFPSNSVSRSHFPILPSLFLRFQCGKCSITPTITMALYISQNKVGLSPSLPFSVPLFAKLLHPVPHTKCWLPHYRAYFVCINTNRVLPFPSPFSTQFLFLNFCDK